MSKRVDSLARSHAKLSKQVQAMSDGAEDPDYLPSDHHNEPILGNRTHAQSAPVRPEPNNDTSSMGGDKEPGKRDNPYAVEPM